MKSFRHIVLLFAFFLSLTTLSASGERRGGVWHYFTGFNVSCLPSFNTPETHIPARIPFGALCGAMNDHIGAYVRISLSPNAVGTKNEVENLEQLGDLSHNKVLPDGRVALKSVYNQLVVGPVFNLKRGFSVYVGVGGYQMKTYLKNTEDEYVSVSKFGSASWAIDAGVMYHFRHLFFTGGATVNTAKWTDKSPYSPFWTGNLTVGYFF